MIPFIERINEKLVWTPEDFVNLRYESITVILRYENCHISKTYPYRFGIEKFPLGRRFICNSAQETLFGTSINNWH